MPGAVRSSPFGCGPCCRRPCRRAPRRSSPSCPAFEFRPRVFLELKAQRMNSAAGRPAVEPDGVRYASLTTGG